MSSAVRTVTPTNNLLYPSHILPTCSPPSSPLCPSSPFHNPVSVQRSSSVGNFAYRSSLRGSTGGGRAQPITTNVKALKQLFKELATHSETGGQTVDKQTLLRYLPLPGLLGERLFGVFDVDHNERIDFQEFCTGLAIVYGGTPDDKKKFLFDMYDLDGNGEITREELRTLLYHIPAAYKLLTHTLTHTPSSHTPHIIPLPPLSPPPFSPQGSSPPSPEVFSPCGSNSSVPSHPANISPESHHQPQEPAVDPSPSNVLNSSTLLNMFYQFAPSSPSVPAPPPSVSSNPCPPVPWGGGSNGVSELTRKRIDVIVDDAFSDVANGGGLNYRQFVQALEKRKEILEVLNLFYGDAMPELPIGCDVLDPSLVSRSFNDSFYRRVRNRRAYTTLPQYLPPAPSPAHPPTPPNNPPTPSSCRPSARSPSPDIRGSVPPERHRATADATTAPPKNHLSRLLTSLKGPSSSRAASVHQPSPHSSFSTTDVSFNYQLPPSFSSSCRSLSTTAPAAPVLRCPMCAQQMCLRHCPRCGTELCEDHLKTSTEGDRVAGDSLPTRRTEGGGAQGGDGVLGCGKCGWNLTEIQYCCDCGQPLQSQLLVTDDTDLQQSRIARKSRDDPYSDLTVLSGWLLKVGERFGRWTKRFYVLRDRFLYYYVDSRACAPKGVYFLQNCFVALRCYTGSLKDKLGSHGIDITFPNSKRRAVYCQTAEERDLWFKALQKASMYVSVHDQYVFKEEIGRGKFSTVYGATHKHTSKGRARSVMFGFCVYSYT
eukprot:GHVQ01031257.1.p2 GENE.GHVQ01031257.1~~GHVQ01031257.1.p2  ORF type:complete len:766 (-),score=149.41 GHVQ01031257.1:3980-6277(-)